MEFVRDRDPSRVLLRRCCTRCLNGHKFWPDDKLLVDVRRRLGVEAGCIKALVALYIRKQTGIE